MDRVEAARERVRSVKEELRSPAAYQPCIQCRYYELACTHPAVSQISVNPVSGQPKVRHLSGEEARSADGACGPEGALFDSRSLPAAVIVSILQTTAGKITLGLGALLGCAYLFG